MVTRAVEAIRGIAENEDCGRERYGEEVLFVAGVLIGTDKHICQLGTEQEDRNANKFWAHK